MEKDKYNFMHTNEILKYDRLFSPPYKLKISLSNSDNEDRVEIETTDVMHLHELPCNAIDVIGQYETLQHYVFRHDDDFYLFMNVSFLHATTSEPKPIYEFFNLSVKKLKCILQT